MTEPPGKLKILPQIFVNVIICLKLPLITLRRVITLRSYYCKNDLLQTETVTVKPAAKLKILPQIFVAAAVKVIAVVAVAGDAIPLGI
jgi:hypothetical protein